jgi:hypothetical protein
MISMPNYTANALSLLSQLRGIKDQIKALEAESKLLQQQLAVHAVAGDLDDVQDPDSPNTFRHDDAVFMYSSGRISYDFTHCEDVKAAEDNLKEIKSTNVALGLAPKKLGKPFWTVK